MRTAFLQFGCFLLAASNLAAGPPVQVNDALTSGGCVYGVASIHRPASVDAHNVRQPANAGENIVTGMLGSGSARCSYTFTYVPGKPLNGRGPLVYTVLYRVETMDPQYRIRTSYPVSGWLERATEHCYRRKREIPCVHAEQRERRLMAAHRLYTVNGGAAWVEDAAGNLAKPPVAEKQGIRYIWMDAAGKMNMAATPPRR